MRLTGSFAMQPSQVLMLVSVPDTTALARTALCGRCSCLDGCNASAIKAGTDMFWAFPGLITRWVFETYEHKPEPLAWGLWGSYFDEISPDMAMEAELTKSKSLKGERKPWQQLPCRN